MRLLGIVLALLAVAACTYVEQNNPLASEALSVEKERELTADVARQIRAQLPLVNDPVLLAYLNELGQEIVATTEPQPFLYRFTIIDDEALNAFTIGGGYVYIHSGVIAAAGDVAELQGVIAHEVAHVRERHIAKRGEDQGVSTLITLVTRSGEFTPHVAVRQRHRSVVVHQTDSLILPVQELQDRYLESEALADRTSDDLRTPHRIAVKLDCWERLVPLGGYREHSTPVIVVD